MEDAHQGQLLLQAAEQAVGDYQSGRAAPSVPDLLHLEKRWARLPGASGGAVALDDAKKLLGAEVLAGEPLEYVVQEVLASLGLGAPSEDSSSTQLSKRQFLALAHVAELAQGRAFDLGLEEDAAALRAEPASGHKKKPPPIRDAHIDTWRIAAAPAGAGEAGAEPASPLQDEAAAAEVDQGAASLSRQGSGAAEEGLGLGDDEAASAAAAALAHQHQLLQQRNHLQSGGTSYVSALEEVEEAEGLAGGEGALPLDVQVDEIGTRIEGLMERMNTDMARLNMGPGGSPLAAQASPGASGGASKGSVAAAPAEQDARGSWESFNSASSGGRSARQQQQQPAGTTPQQGPQQVQEAMISAAMAAGMTFMQTFMQQTGGQVAPPAGFGQAAAVAAAAVAASPSVGGSFAGGSAGVSCPSPDVAPGAAAAAGPQQLIAEMMQQALARQQQAGAYPASSHAGSVGSASGGAASGDHSLSHAHHSGQHSARHSPQDRGRRGAWRAFEDENQAQPALSQQHSQHSWRDASLSPQKPSRLGPAGSAGQAVQDALDMPPPAPRLRPPPVEGLCAGWTAMEQADKERCKAVFKKKGFKSAGGMEQHHAMEYFAKLRMQPHIFHSAWAAADQGCDGRLDTREFCLFLQLLRGAQRGLPVPRRVSPAEAAGLLGEKPMPPPAVPAAGPALHIDSARMRSALAGGGHSRQGSLAEPEFSVIQGFDPDDDDTASSVDSGIAESIISTGSRTHGASPFALGARPAGPTPSRSRLGSVLGGGGGAGAYNPAYARSERGGMAAPGVAAAAAAGSSVAEEEVVHSLLEVAVRSAVIKYRKPLSTPIFTLSVRDSLGRLVELPIDTHPGHYRRETSMIHSSAIVRLASQLRTLPRGSTLFVEIKHWKSDKKRFSTLAWAAAPLEALVDFGPKGARVRSGPVDLPLFKKPLDPNLRKVKRLASRSADLHLQVRGIE